MVMDRDVTQAPSHTIDWLLAFELTAVPVQRDDQNECCISRLRFAVPLTVVSVQRDDNKECCMSRLRFIGIRAILAGGQAGGWNTERIQSDCRANA